MRPRTILASVILLLACGLMLPAWASAEVVGHITQVEGRVDLLKGGKLPATPVALQDKVESGDVLRTKSLSKAQITFIDNSVITLSPESRLAVDEYRFDPAQQKRNAVLNLFQGMAHVVVNKLFKVDEPDFVIKTHTAVTGVRGTDFGIRLQPNASTILNFQGITQVANIFPEVGKLDLRAFKAAFAFGSANSPNSVTLGPMQGTTVTQGLPPTLPYGITAQDQKQFMNQVNPVVIGQQGSGSGSAAGGGSGSGSGGGSSGIGAIGAGTAASGGGGGTEFMTNLGGPDSGLITQTPTPLPVILIVTVPPVVEPPVTPPVVEPPVTPPPTPATYTFQQTGYSAWVSTPSSNISTALTSTGWTQRTGSWPAGTFPTYYTSTSTGVRNWSDGATWDSSISTGTSTGTLTGIVTGVLGSNLTGTATYNGISSFGQTTNYSGNVVIDPSGQMTFTYANGRISSFRRLVSASGTTIYVPGAYFTQTLDGVMSNTSSAPYTGQSTSTTWGGATTTSGSLAQYYAVSLTSPTPNTSPWAFNYLAQNYDTLAGTVQGVVNPTTLQGAATVTPSDRDKPFVSLLSTPPSPYLFGRGANDTLPIVTTVSIDPAGVLSGQLQTTDYQNGKYASGVYSLTQTPQTTQVTPPASATYAFTQNYNGSLYINSGLAGSPSNTLQAQGNGWGLTTGVANPSWASGALALPAPYSGTMAGNTGWFSAWDQGTWNVTSGSWPSSTYPYGYGAAVGVTQMSGTVSGVLGQTLTSPTGQNMTFIGSLLNGFSFSYNGSVTINSYGELKFTYTAPGSTWAWTAPGGTASGTASGTLQQYPGYHFTQTTTGNYTLTSTLDQSGKRYNGTLTIPTSAWTRTGVYDGTVSGVEGTVSLYSPDGTLPASGSGSVSLAGVVGTSENGATFGNANLSMIGSPYNISIPGSITLTPGGSFFNPGGVFVQPTVGPSPVGTPVNAYSGTPLTTGSLYSFSQTYNGFRLGTALATPTLASVEGYGWGLRTSPNLPTNYTGYFVAQDLGTRASATPLSTNWAGVTALTMTGTVSGVSGQTLSGQMIFNGTSQNGTTFNYSGQVTLGTDGRLLYNYYGNWVNGTQTGTGTGNLLQVPGTYFTETASGTATQSSTTMPLSPSGTLSTTSIKDTAPLSGTRTEYLPGGTTIASTNTSFAAGQTSTVNTFPTSSTGPITLSTQGVLAGPTWDTRWGVATTTSTPGPGQPLTGVVTIDPTGKLTGQVVDQKSNGSLLPSDKLSVNVVSVTTASGMTTSSFAQTAAGTINLTPVSGTTGTQATITNPIPLTGTSAGTISGQINTNLAITSTAMQPNTYNNAISPTIIANTVGAVAGPAGGVQTGVATIQTVTTTTTPVTITTGNLVGTATLQPATPTAPATLTTTVTGVNPVGVVPAVQTGTVTVTKQ